jgi:hypothetical protein
MNCVFGPHPWIIIHLLIFKQYFLQIYKSTELAKRALF